MNSIDAALNPDNYKEINYLNGRGEWETFTGYLGPKSNKNTPKIVLSSDQPRNVGRQRTCDVITGPVGQLKPGVVVESEIQAWKQFIDN